MITEKFVSIEGVKLFCRIEGEGRPLLFLHGGPGSNHDYFVPFVHELARHRKLIFYDQRGCGRSDRLESSQYSIKHFVRELENLVNEIGLEKFDMLGHSWGGMLAQLYAVDHQEELRSLLLCCTASNMEIRKKLYAKMWRNSPKRPRFMLEEYLKSGKLQRGQPYPNDYITILNQVKRRTNHMPKDLQIFMGMIRAGFSWEVHDALMGGGLYEFNFDGELKNFDLGEELPKIRIPTMIIAGKNDLDFPEKGRDLNKLIPNSKLVIYPNSGHWPFLQENRKFLNETEAFLSRLD